MIARTSFLPSRLSRLVFGLAGASSLVACGGHTVSLGNTSEALKSVDPAAATAAINNSNSSASGACPAGFAHPNICCDAAAGVTSACGEWTVDPFRACTANGPSWTTYPNAFQCCSLTDPSDCSPTPPDAGATAPTPPPPIGCGFVCPPGWWFEGDNTAVPVTTGSTSSSGSAGSGGTTNSGGTTTSGSTGTTGGTNIVSSSGACCTTLVDGSTYCNGWGYAEPATTVCGGSGSSSGGIADPTPIFADGGTPAEDAGSPCICACPANEPDCDCGCGAEDAGTVECDDDAGSAYPPGYDGGPTSLCGACPPGWSTSSEDPLLCCVTTPDNVEECFSQATGSASGFSSGSTGTTSAGSSSSSSSGGTVDTPPVTTNSGN
jgi:hypothetical protein